MSLAFEMKKFPGEVVNNWSELSVVHHAKARNEEVEGCSGGNVHVPKGSKNLKGCASCEHRCARSEVRPPN
eukprot:1024800-Pyramimonas_sp.AAC.1